MALNNNIGLPGYTAYTIGVRVTALDVALGGKNPSLLVQNLTFVGNGSTSPYQSANSIDDVQTLQSQYINADSKNAANRVGPSNKSGPDVHMGATTQENLFTDSWWYSSSSGKLTGIFNSNAQIGTIKSDF